jgi:hypothetical protein
MRTYKRVFWGVVFNPRFRFVVNASIFFLCKYLPKKLLIKKGDVRNCHLAGQVHLDDAIFAVVVVSVADKPNSDLKRQLN